MDKIVKNIAHILKELYPSRMVYTELARQGFQRGSFLVECADYRDELFRGKRRRVDFTIEISVYPLEVDKLNEEQREYKQTLSQALEIIETQYGLLRIQKLEITDRSDRKNRRSNGVGELAAEKYSVFAASYGFYYIEEDENELMRELTINGGAEIGGTK